MRSTTVDEPKIEKPYHVALSFAGEDRDYVEAVAVGLDQFGIRVFYDKYEEAKLWGKDLYSHLSNIYRHEAYFTLMFISQHYKKKLWTNHERKSAQARAFEKSREYILPARFDDTEIPGIIPTTGYIALTGRTPQDLVELIIQKLEEYKIIDRADLPRASNVDPIPRLILEALSASAKNGPLSKVRDQLGYSIRSASQYVDYCHNLYQNMRILAMPKPIELSHIFTQVRVADRVRSNQSATEVEILQAILAKRGERSTGGFNAAALLKNIPRSVLLGRPGSGKSTFLKYMTLRELQSGSIRQIPILIHLNELDRHNKSLITNTVAVVERAGIENAHDLVLALLKSGKIRMLIDGLDELRVDDRRQVVDEVDEMMKKFHKNSFLITCRTAAYEYWFGDCHHYEVQQFSRRAIVYFVIRWFSEDKKKARELLNQILPHSRMRDLCSSPLMLTIVCIGFESGIDLSNNRAEIYKDAIDALLKKWDASRSIYRDNVYKSLTPKRREDLLSDLAARTFVESQIAIPKAAAEKIVGDFLNTMPSSSDTPADSDAEVVLQAIETQHGLIEKRSA